VLLDDGLDLILYMLMSNLRVDVCQFTGSSMRLLELLKT